MKLKGKKSVEPKAEEKKSSEEPKMEEEEKPAEEKNTEESKAEGDSVPPPPPPEIVLKVFMHCEGCARKVRHSLKRFQGVEEVIADCKSQKVVIKGNVDPLKVLDRVQKKSHRQVELISPIPKPPSEEENKPIEDEKPKPEEKKQEPQIVTVVLKVYMHCEACAQEIKRRILKMKGVESAEPDLKNSQVSVKGAFDPAKLVEYVYKRTGKHTVIVKQETEKKEKEEEAKEEASEEKKEEEDEKESNENEGEEAKEENQEEVEEVKEEEKEAESTEEEETKIAEVKRSGEYFYNPTFARYGMGMYAHPPPQFQSYPPQFQQLQPYPPQPYPPQPYPPQQYPPQQYPVYQAYPPQVFSDENPNSCTVM